jgi:hypothetical protein
MESRNIILKELQEISPVLASSYPLPVPFKVPDGYFGQLPSAALALVKTSSANAADELQALSLLLGSISKRTPYHLPEDYFRDLAENTVAETKALAFVQQELDDFSPILNDLRNAQVYQVPAGYFDQLPNAILDKIKEQQSAKIVQMPRRSNLRRYIAAAAVLLVMITGAWWYFQQPGGKGRTTDFAQVPDEELINFLNEQPLAAEPGSAVYYTESDNNAMHDLLADVSDEELQQYVEKNSSLINSYN